MHVSGGYNPSVLKMENGANGRPGNGRKKRHSGGGNQRIDENEGESIFSFHFPLCSSSIFAGGKWG